MTAQIGLFTEEKNIAENIEEGDEEYYFTFY